MDVANGQARYFIKFNFHDGALEIQISQKIFNMYISEFNKPMERQRNEKRRHIENVEIKSHTILGSNFITLFEQDSVTKADIEAALKSCTPAQRKRVLLHYFEGYSFREIADMQRCDESAIRRSITAALKKIKKYFS